MTTSRNTPPRIIDREYYRGRGRPGNEARTIDGEIKSVTKNIVTQKLGLLGVLGKYTENSKISLSLVLLKNSNTFYFAVE